jgi:hypothetical protein
MAAKYSNEVMISLEGGLVEILLDAQVAEEQAKWLATAHIRTVAAFADLVDDKSQVAAKIGTASGIDIQANDAAVKLQPIKTAWRVADSQFKATLEAKAKGEEIDHERPLPESTSSSGSRRPSKSPRCGASWRRRRSRPTSSSSSTGTTRRPT